MTVRKKGDKWYCRFQLDGVRYERRCALATNEKEAKKIESIIKTEILRGNYNYSKARNATKLKEGIELFKKYSFCNKSSHKSDMSNIKKIIDFFGNNCPLDIITPSKIEDFKIYLKSYKVTEKIKINNPEYGKMGCRKKYIYKEIIKEKNRSNATINRHLELLSKMFNLCIENDLIEKNPCQAVGQLREENFKIRFLTTEEEKALFNAIETTSYSNKNNEVIFPYIHLKPLIICALQTGMRRSEIFGLKWAQVDFKNGFIDVLKTKSGKARKIPISKRLETILKDVLATSGNNDYVFINMATNKPYTDIKKSFSTVLKNANIENFRFHDLRHTVATRMVESGVDLLVVQEILGHSNIQTTMRYAHPVPERKKKAIDCLCDLY